MVEQRDICPDVLRTDLPARVVELLARPKLTDLPDSPVGRILKMFQGVYADFNEVDLPEILDLTEAIKIMGEDLPYLSLLDLCRIDDHRIVRSDLALPLVMRLRFQGPAAAGLGCR